MGCARFARSASTPGVHAGFADFRDRVVLADADRAERFSEHELDLRSRFTALAGVSDAGFEFRQPMRVNLLVKE